MATLCPAHIFLMLSHQHHVAGLCILHKGGSLTFIFNIFIIQFREKCKQRMKKTFRENVFVCKDFSLNCKENELHRKYMVFGGSTENLPPPPIFETEQNGRFHWI